MSNNHDVMKTYGDIIHLSRPVSTKHKPMTIANRAAQFAPFAALTGYDQALIEKARLTDQRPLLSEEEKQNINNVLHEIFDQIRKQPDVRVMYFEPDAKKEGGKIITLHSFAVKLSIDERYLMVENKQRISIDDILDVQILEAKETR